MLSGLVYGVLLYGICIVLKISFHLIAAAMAAFAGLIAAAMAAFAGLFAAAMAAFAGLFAAPERAPFNVTGELGEMVHPEPEVVVVPWP